MMQFADIVKAFREGEACGRSMVPGNVYRGPCTEALAHGYLPYSWEMRAFAAGFDRALPEDIATDEIGLIQPKSVSAIDQNCQQSRD